VTLKAWCTGVSSCILAATFMTSVAGSKMLLATLEFWSPPVTALPTSDNRVIVLLSGRLDRSARAAELHLRTKLPIYIAGDAPAKQAGEHFAEHLEKAYGIKPTWIEADSRNTEGNAARAAWILQPQGISSIALVTDRWHMLRASLWFRYYGFRVTPTPSVISTSPSAVPDLPIHSIRDFFPSVVGWQRTQVFVKEWVGIAQLVTFRVAGLRRAC
jgi:uncharacterized SAM-binding protein YcdF (DUF218 family)